MGVNKVTLNGETKIDLSGDTVTPQTLLAGATAHNAAGEEIAGSLTIPVTSVNGDTGAVKTTFTIPLIPAGSASGYNVSADSSATYAEISAAIQSGKTVVAEIDDYISGGQKIVFTLATVPPDIWNDGDDFTLVFHAIYGDVILTLTVNASSSAIACEITGSELGQGGSSATQYTGTLTTGWTTDANGYRKKTITISGLAASYSVDPQWDVVLTGTDRDADAALLEAFALIHSFETGANSLTAICIGQAPTVNIPIKVVTFG